MFASAKGAPSVLGGEVNTSVEPSPKLLSQNTSFVEL